MSTFPSEQAQPTEAGRISGGLVGKVFALLAFSLAFAAVGGWVGYGLEPGWILPIFLVQFGLIFAVQAFREREPWNLILLYGFAFMSGLTIGPIIAEYVSAGLGDIVIQAVVVTGAMVAVLSLFALTTKWNLLSLAPFVLIALIGLIVASIVNIWVGGSTLYAIVSWAGALIFSVLLVIDVQRAKFLPDTLGNAVVIALGVYLDVVNLFLFVLRILGVARR
jgi:modulator of FtsH protease